VSKRSIKVGGSTTSLFLEDAFWNEIQIRAEKEDVSNAEFLRNLLLKCDEGENRSAAIKEFLITELRSEFSSLQNTVSLQNKSRWFIEYKGVRKRQEFTTSVISIGSSKHCDIVLDSEDIAVKQAFLVFKTQEWWIINLGTSLPIIVNGMVTGATMLQQGSEVDIGEYQVIRG
jgi:predicted DNA-binding ribbon-helix-helix protein